MLNPLDDPSRLLKPGEVALILRVSRTQIYRLLRTKLPAIRFGGSTVRFSLAGISGSILMIIRI